MDQESADHEKTTYRNFRKYPSRNPVEWIERNMAQQCISMCNDHKRCKKETEEIEIVMMGCVIQISAYLLNNRKEALK